MMNNGFGSAAAGRNSPTLARVSAQPPQRWIMLGVVLGLCAVTLAPARADLTSASVHKDEHFVTAETPGILDIEAGECFTDPAFHPSAGGEVVLYTPCGQGSDNQAYGFVHLPDGPFDRDRVEAQAWDRCERGFTVLSIDAALDFYPVVPTRETWADGDRDVMCVAYDPAGSLAGSVLPRA